jgi:hypothetical protein
MLERSAHLLEAVLFPLDRFDLDSDHRGVAQVRLWILKLLACESACTFSASSTKPAVPKPITVRWRASKSQACSLSITP